MHAHTRAHMHTHTRTHTHARTHAHTHTHTHTHQDADLSDMPDAITAVGLLKALLKEGKIGCIVQHKLAKVDTCTSSQCFGTGSMIKICNGILFSLTQYCHICA